MPDEDMSIEDSIMATVDEGSADLPPYGSEPDDSTIAETQTTDASPGTAGDALPNAGAADQQSTGEGGGADTKTQQPSAGTQQDGRPRDDGRGNLVDADGNVIANRGAERRVYERAQRMQAQYETLETHAREQARKIDELNKVNQQATSLGLTTEDRQGAYEVMAQFKRDPVAAARAVVQQAMALGHNLQSIIGGADGSPSAVDMGAIKQLIDQRMAPVDAVKADREAQVREVQIEQQATREYNEFLNSHPYSDVHQDAIAVLMRDQQVNAPVAYARLAAWINTNRYDITQPLEPQMAARQNGGSNGAPVQQTQQPHAPSIPVSGRGMAAGGVVPNDTHVQEGASMSAEATMDEIVRNSMREAGFRLE